MHQNCRINRRVKDKYKFVLLLKSFCQGEDEDENKAMLNKKMAV